jgi:molecular chaperone DnaJ
MPNVRSGRHGNLHVQVVVETPRQLTKRQEEVLRELAEMEDRNVSPQRKSWLEKIKQFFTDAPKK